MKTNVRVDQWLRVARVFKTRSQATRACGQGKVQVDGQTVKAHRRLAVGDRVEIRLRDRQRVLVVRKLRDKPIPKADVPELFEDLSPPPPEPRGRSSSAKLDVSPGRRERGAGRPTKRDRRRIDRLR